MRSETVNKFQRLAGAGAVAAVAAVAGYSLHDAAVAQGTTSQTTNGSIPAASSAAPAVKTPAIQNAASMQNAFSEVAHVAEPAVVTITTAERQQPVASRGGRSRLFGRPGSSSEDDPFQEFMRRFRSPSPDGDGISPNSYKGKAVAPSGIVPIQAPADRTYRAAPPSTNNNSNLGPLVETGLGSGFIYDKSGLILTNAHVVSGADRVTVKLQDGRTFKNARVLGIDQRSDVAVVKIPITNAPAVTLGDSAKVDVGDWAIAVGNPFGLSNTLTVGVISATAREVQLSPDSANDYLQTDASINRGNSGGPLLDIYGRVVGINNAIYSQSGGSVGIGFAIPINVAKQIADQLATTGHVRRAVIGVKMSGVDSTTAASYGLPANTRGVIVDSVVAGTPAERAGIQVGDVITAWNGQPVIGSADLQRKVTSSPIGTAGSLTILRDGKSLTISITPIELKENSPTPRRRAAAPTTTPVAPAPDALGAVLAPLNDETRSQFRIPGTITSGVLVADVQEGSPAARAGIQPGDIIQRVAQTKVTTQQELASAKDRLLNAQTGDSKSVALYVQRGGENGYEGGFIVVPISD